MIVMVNFSPEPVKTEIQGRKKSNEGEEDVDYSFRKDREVYVNKNNQWHAW